MSIFIWALILVQILLLPILFMVGVIGTYFAINSGFMHNPPPVPSCGKVKHAMINDVAKVLEKRKNQTVMDLGSGWGSLLIPLAKRFPNHQFIGIEYGFLPYWFSKFRSRKLKNMTFRRENLFNTDISYADVIFLFLFTSTMRKTTQKCLTEAKKGTLIYVNRFPMYKTKPYKEVSLGSKYYTYYIYKI